MVRHGVTPTTGQVLPGRAKGLHLSEEGQAQAEQVGEVLAAKYPNVSAVYTSPLERCRETSRPFSKAVGIKPVVDKGLLECEFGDWTGRKLKDLAKLPEWTTVQRNPSAFTFPNGESFLGMQSRITQTLASLAEHHKGETVVVFSHADPIKAALATALGVHLDLFQRIVVSPCSYSVVTYTPTGPVVQTVNATAPS